MEIALLRSATYVEDKYNELKRKRPEEKESDSTKDTPSSSYLPAIGAMRLDALSSFRLDKQGPTLPPEDRKKLNEAIQELEGMWPVTLLEKKLVLLYNFLDQMSSMKSARREHMVPINKDKLALASVTTLESLPLSTQLAVKLFFRLIQTIRSRSQACGNYTTLLRLIHQLPRMLTDLPPLSLSPEQHLQTNDKSIFEEIFNTVQQVPTSSREDQEAALSSLLGLSIKRGRLYHILLVIRLLLQAPPTLPMQLAYPFLQELTEAKPEETDDSTDDGQRVGYLMSFGKGDHGKLGHGTCNHPACADSKCTENKIIPTMLESTRDLMFKKIDSLSTHSVAVSVHGELYTWGNGEKYRLGHGDATKEYTPRFVEAFRSKPRVKDVACGLGHTIVLLVSGEMYAWGNGGNGRLGLGDMADQTAPMKVPFPDEIDRDRDNASIVAVFCGASHSLAINQQGRLYTWGKNNQGQCGHGHTNDQLTPAEVLYFDDMEMHVLTVAGGWEHTLICTTNGKAYACGCGYKDSRRAGLPPVLGLGSNDTERRLKPTLIPLLDDCTAVACGWDHSLALTRDGSAYSWGSGSNGKLGHGDEDNRDIPTKILGLQGKYIQEIKAGCEHTTAITDSGEMYTWGHSDSGRLGHGDNLTRKTPSFVESFAWQGYRPVSIAVGDKYNLVLVQPVVDGAVRANNQTATNTQGKTPRSVAPSAPDSTIPLTAVTLTSQLMHQLDRLSNAYMPQENSQLLERLKYLYMHPITSPTALAYAVDISNDTFQLLVDIISTTNMKAESDDPATPRAASLSSKVLARSSLVLTSLRLIKVNLYQLLSCSHLALSPSTLMQLHDLLSGLATLSMKEDIHEINQCSADALKIGFQIFYPTGAEQHHLLWQFMSANHTADLVLRQALTDRLCQDYVIVDLMARLFAKNHTCSTEKSTSESWKKDNLTANDLKNLMMRLLKQCTSSDTQEPSMQLRLKMLATLQSHLFSAWNSSYCSPCVAHVLEPYLECLLGEGLNLLRKVHKGLLKDNNVVKLQPSFFYLLVPLAVECIAVTHLRSNVSLGKVLLPLLLPMLKLLDEIAYKISEDAKVSNQILPDIEWIAELENVCSFLAGRYSCAFIVAFHPKDANQRSVPQALMYICRHGKMNQGSQEDLSQKWEDSHVYEIENELQQPEPLPNDVTLVDHMAIIDWVNGQGVLEDFHQYMLAFVNPLPESVEVLPLAVVVWHSSLLPSIFSCIASIGTSNLKTNPDNTPPPDLLLQVWEWVINACAKLETINWDNIRNQGKELLQYYPCQGLFSAAVESDIPPCLCRKAECSSQSTVKATISLPELLLILSQPILFWPTFSSTGSSLKIAGLSIAHDLLCKLTSEEAKCELLRAFVEPAEHFDGSLAMKISSWQEPRVAFEPHVALHSITPLDVLEHDMHAQHGIFHQRKLHKAIENFYIRLAKLVANPDCNVLLKKRALNMWCVDFHDTSTMRNSGILHTLGEILEHSANSGISMNLDDSIHNSPHGCPPSHCLPPRLRPVEKLVYMSSASSNLHNMCWHVFSWLCKQFLMTADQAFATSILRHSSSSKALVCTSPRKRLSLPPKLIVSTWEESIDLMFYVLLHELNKTKDALLSWNTKATEMAINIKDSHAVFLANPHVVSSVHSTFVVAKDKVVESGWSLCAWIHIDEFSLTPLILVASGEGPEYDMILTIEPQGLLALSLKSREKIISKKALQCGGWTHVCCTFTTLGTTIFVDGEALGQGDGPSTIHIQPSFSIGGLVDPLKSDYRTSHILLDDLTIHSFILLPTQIASLAASGSFLLRIKQREVLDTYCTSVLSLLSCLASIRAPSLAEDIPLLMALLPICPPSAHDLLFQLFTSVLPSISPSMIITPVSTTLLQFLIDQFGAAWFSSTNLLYGPHELYQSLTLRKDNCLSHLLEAGLFKKDGVASWLIMEQHLKSKSLSLLRSTRASLVESFVKLFHKLMLSTAWAMDFAQYCHVEAPETVLIPHRSGALTAKDKVIPLVLSLYVMGGFVKSIPTQIKMGDNIASLLDWVLKHPPCIDGHGASSDIDQDVQIATYMHIRSCLLRLCLLQTKQLSVADMMLQHQSIVPELLKLAIQQLPAALSAVFGKEFDVISKMENVHALIAWMKDESNEERIKKRAVIETFSTTLFQRLPYINEGDLTPWWVLNAAQHIVVLGGEVEVDEYRIKGLQHFPTVKLNGVSISAGTGIWYYEVVLLSEGLMQIGWIDSAFESDALQGQGVGDHTNSWAYDGFRQKKWNVEAMDYGEKWRSGDVVGVLLDSDRCEMQYFLNGRPLGVAFEDLRLNHPLVPAISLNVDQSAQLHFTANQFLYLPPIDKIQPVSSAILGHVCEHSNPSASSNQQAQENETRRTELIEGLIGLGFPPEWALRCARETSHDLSESGAIAWIMEQMENDNHAVRPVLHGLDYSVRNMQQLDGFTESKPHLLVVSETPLPIHTEEPKPLSTNPFLTEEFCEDAFDEAPFPQQSLPRTSHESEPNRKAASFVLSLADSCRDEEIFPLYIIAESALTILYAQDIANNLVHHASRTKKTCFPETLFLDFIQHVIGMRNDSVERQDYTRVIESICHDNPAFVSVLLNNMLRHFQMACSKEHMYTSFANNTSMTKSIAINMEWSCWLADVLLSISRHCVAANLLIFTPNVWQTLIKAAMSPNATLRHRAIVVTAKFLKEGSPSMESLLRAKIEHFVEWLAVKIRKEKPTRVLYSEYVQSLFYLVVTLDSFFPAKSARLDDNQPSTPDLIVEQINPSSATISIKCSLSEASHFQIAEHGFNSSGYEILEFTNLDEIDTNSTQSSHVIPDLRPDTMYRLRLASEGNTYSSGIDIRTPSESVLELDPTSMGSNLELLNHNMSVRNRVNKKWHAVRASVAYTSGVHSWDVRIDKCVSKNIFVGICTVDASMENYIGSDAWGWGFLANKAVWHNKSKVQSYGEIFKQGDVINVTLNLDRGTLSFARNGESFGVAVDHLTSNNGDTGYFPAISMYNKDDQVTFAPHEPSSTKSGGAGVATTMQHVRDMELLAQLFEPASISWDSSVYSAWIKWTHSQMNRVISANGEIIEFTTSEVASAPFGLHQGDIVFTPKGMCKVLGIAQYVLWYRLDAHGASASGVGSNTYGFWNVATCRDILARPHDFPITRRHQHTEPLCSVPTQVSLDEFVEAQKRWTQQLDDQLICHVEQIANLRGYSSVFEISANDILATPSPIASFTQFECLCRLGVIHTANKLFQRLAPLIVSLSSPFISLLHRTRHVLVFPVVEKVIHDLFKKSSTITMPSASVSTTEEDTDEDPIEIPRCKLVLPSTPCAPCWEHNKITTPLASASGNSISLLAQLTAFFERIDPRDLRRHYHNATTSSSLYATSSPQPRTFRVVCDDLTCDQSTAYMHVLREVAREAQSPRSPLFVPIEGSGSVLVTKLMINPVDFSEEILASYTTVGRVMGIAWRSGIPLPWCLSAVIWKFIVHEDLQLSDWIGMNTLGDTTLSIVQTAMAMASWTESDFEKHSIPFALPSDESPSVAVVRVETYKEYVNAVLAHVLAPFRPALSALVTGLTSIVPRTCFLFLSAAQLQRQLAATLDLLHLQEATTYGDELTSSSPTVLWFWKIVHGLSKDDQRLFCRFVVGQDAWHSSMHVELRSSPSLRLPASVNASAEDALSGYGYPYVERPSESTFVLYLPEYASMDTLQKKLLVAMRHSGSG